MSYVYLLSNGKKTYIGATKNPDRRLRQHNRELVGGAKATSGSKWERVLLISGLPDWRTALQLEWAWKYMSRKLKVRGLLGRIDALIHLFNLPRCTSNAVPYIDWASDIYLTGPRIFVGVLEKIEKWSDQSSEGRLPIVNILPSDPQVFLASLSFKMSADLSILIKAIEALVKQQATNNKLVAEVLEHLTSGKAPALAGVGTKTTPTKGKRGPKAKPEKAPKVKAVPPPPEDGVVRFGSASTGDYKEFSSFYKSPFTVGDKSYGSLAHYFHSMKFAGTDDDFAEDIRTQKNPALTRSKASSIKDHSPIADWDTEKLAIMKAGLRAKFDANPELRGKLLSTGTAPIEATIEEEMRVKDYWSIGTDGTGANHMGRLLMEVRAELTGVPAAATPVKKPAKKPAAAPKKAPPPSADSDSDDSEDEAEAPVAKALVMTKATKAPTAAKKPVAAAAAATSDSDLDEE